METKFTKFTKSERFKGFKKTKFDRILITKYQILEDVTSPRNWHNVEHIGYDEKYGDVFKCWDDGEIGFTLYFGEKGDEFNQ